MGYVPLNNYNHDGGYKRIQSGPNHQGFIVLTSGSTAYGANEGIVVPGSPLSGTAALGAWDYDANWRYVPSTLPGQSGSLDPTPYNVSGALDTYDATRIYTRDTVAGAQAASAIGPETGKINPRGGALQARSDVTRPETYMYYGGAAPDNQDYSPYNTPDANSAAEGKTGGGVTHKAYESTLLTNVLGSQGTSDRSQWRYHQPVYCKTYTETRRSETPGLMSTPLRYVYRGSASSYNYNYGGELLANKGGFELLPYDDEVLGCPFPVGCPTSNGIGNTLTPGDILIATPPCTYLKIEWFNTDQTLKLGEGTTYTIQESDIGTEVYYLVTYSDGSTDQSSLDCFEEVEASLNTNFFYLNSVNGPLSSFDRDNPIAFYPAFDIFGNYYVQSWWDGGAGGSPIPNPYKPVLSAVNKNRELLWSYDYNISDGYTQAGAASSAHCFDGENLHCFTIKRDPTNIKVVYIQNLVLDPITGALKQIRGLRYFISTITISVPSIVLRVEQVETDKSGNFWLSFYAPEEYGVGGLGTLATGVIALIQTLPDNSLTTAWTYEVIVREIIPASRYAGSIAQGFRLDLEKNLIYFQSYLQASSYKPTLVVLNSNTGQVLYKQPFATVNGDPTILGYRTNYIDNENNLYQVANNSINQTIMNNGSAMWISRKNSDKSIIWMKNYSSVLDANHTCSTNGLLIVQDKLIFLLARLAGLPSITTPVLLIIDKETGNLERNIRITTSPVNDYGYDLTIVKGLRPNEFILMSSYGYCLTLNISNIPLNTTLVTTNPAQVYTFTDFTISGVEDYTSYTLTSLALPPDQSWPATETYYTLPVTSGTLEPLASPTRVSGVYLTP